MSSERSALRRGVVGGLIAATAIVVFYLVVDLVRGAALVTPSFLAGVLRGGDPASSPGLIAVYTLLHYGVFVGLGVGVAWVLDRVGAPATPLLGVILGFLLFDLMFYGSVALTGVDVARGLGWPSLLAANLLGGLALAGYLGRTGPYRSRSWRDALKAHPALKEGLVAGLLGALVVAAWFLILDLAAGRPLYTPAALGSALLSGVDSPAGVEITAATVGGYSLVHFGGFALMGLVFAGLVRRAEESPPLAMGLVLLFVTFETLLLGLVAIAAAWLLEVVPWWSIALANILAAAAMAGYLWRRHPELTDASAGGGPPAEARSDGDLARAGPGSR
jgi:hypothetical protein